MSKLNEAMKIAFDRGYRVIYGKVYAKNKEVKAHPAKRGILYFSVRIENEIRKVAVHRLAAYQKFKDAMFAPGIVVRHKDGNHLNNLHSNLLIGTASDNYMDQKPAVRIARATHAASFLKKYDNAAILARRQDGATLKQLMKEFNISSKGTISYIVNHGIRPHHSKRAKQ